MMYHLGKWMSEVARAGVRQLVGVVADAVDPVRELVDRDSVNVGDTLTSLLYLMLVYSLPSCRLFCAQTHVNGILITIGFIYNTVQGSFKQKLQVNKITK